MSDSINSSAVRKDEHDATSRRITFTSPRPFDQAISTLNYELNASKAGLNLIKLLSTATSREELVEGINNMREGRDFVLFNAASYNWLNVYFGEEQKFPRTLVYTLGNPLLGGEILRHNIDGALYIPPKIFVQETVAGGTRIMYDLPSSLIGRGVQSEGLRAALAELDSKLESLVKRVIEVSARL